MDAIMAGNRLRVCLREGGWRQSKGVLGCCWSSRRYTRPTTSRFGDCQRIMQMSRDWPMQRSPNLTSGTLTPSFELGQTFFASPAKVLGLDSPLCLRSVLRYPSGYRSYSIRDGCVLDYLLGVNRARQRSVCPELPPLRALPLQARVISRFTPTWHLTYLKYLSEGLV